MEAQGNIRVIAEFKIFGWVMGLVAAFILAFVKFVHGMVVNHSIQISRLEQDFARLSSIDKKIDKSSERLGKLETTVAVMAKDNQYSAEALRRMESRQIRDDIPK